MPFFNDPTSCNDLKLTLFLIALLCFSAFYWLYDRGNQAILIGLNHLDDNKVLITKNEQRNKTIHSLQTKLKTLNQQNTTQINENARINKSITLITQISQQDAQRFVLEKQQLMSDISALKSEQISHKKKIDEFVQLQNNNDLKIKTTQQSLRESQQLSQQQFNEFKQLRRDLAQVKFDADNRLKAINDWQQEVTELKKQLVDTKIKIIKSKQRFTVFEMEQDILFDKGQTTLKAEGHQVLARLADIFRQYPNRQIAIQGHSDDQALGPKLKQKYVSNWGLAAARAASAIHYLQNKQSIKPQRIILVSYANYRPKLKGSKPKDFAANRRIEITLLPKDFDILRTKK